MKNFRLCILGLLVTLFGNANLQANPAEESLFWIKECQNDKIYLKSDHLVLSEEGIFVLTGSNSHIHLSGLFCDSQGLYTTMESLPSETAVVYPIVWCSTCGAWRTVNIRGKCVVCGNTP